MNAKVTLGIILLTAFFVGCKNEKSVDDLKVVTPEAPEKVFQVTVDVIVKKDDDFAFYYTVDGSINFYTIQPQWQGVKGSDQVQTISWIVPDNTIPTQLRMDFGMKPDQEDIFIKKFKMDYGGKVFEASGPDVFKYFQPDRNQCTADPATGRIIANVKDGKRVTPSLYPIEEALGKQIELLTKP